ncbi:hypothetical protein [Streptomyces sp. NPDC048659]|uniref:hypothetical protein n=1 Tax=Streptomyces sp. NPDC048659 TaxID=3155489 RepID=UPI003433D8C7
MHLASEAVPEQDRQAGRAGWQHAPERARPWRRTLTAIRPGAGALVAGYLAQVLFRLFLVRHFAYPSIHPDEESYLVLARVLAGRPSTEMPVGVVIPGGYPLLISPALRLADDPATAYHLVMGVNSLLNALVFPLAWVALRRLGLGRAQAYVCATATALLPPVVFYAQYAMTDTVMPVLVLAWALCLHGWFADGSTARRAGHAAGAGLTAAYAMATHDRGGVVVALTAGLLAGAALLRWAPWRTLLAGLGALAAGVFGAQALNGWLRSRFTAPASSVGDFLWQGLTDPQAAGRTLTRTAGQIWYVAVSTWTVGAVGIVVCLLAVAGQRVPRAFRIVGGALLALLAGIALAAAAALPDDKRIDDWVYARYAACLVPTLFLVGCAALVRLRGRALGAVLAGAVGLTLLFGGAVLLSAGPLLRTQTFTPWGMPDALFLAGDWHALHILRTTAAAFAVLCAVVLVRALTSRQALWSGLALTLFAGVATVTITARISDPYSEGARIDAVRFAERTGLRLDDNVVFGWGIDRPVRRVQAYQIYLGRVWYLNPRYHPVPPAATALVLPLPLPRAGRYPPPESAWPRPSPPWFIERVDPQRRWTVWRRH